MGNLAAAKKLRAKLGRVDKKAVKVEAKPLEKQSRDELIASAKALGIEIAGESKAQILELIAHAKSEVE
jgi:hypothetical protein